MNSTFGRFPGIAILLVAVALISQSGFGQIQPSTGQPGWLILRGELVEGPYRVEISENSVEINGRSLAKPRFDAPVVDTSSADYVRLDGLYQRFWALWPYFVQRDGLDKARQDAVWFWSASPVVVSAGLDVGGHGDLVVHFAGDDYPEHLQLEIPDTALSPSASEPPDSLREFRDEIANLLSGGNLVVIDDEGHWYATSPGEGQAVLQKINEAAGRPPGAERFEAMRLLIPDDQLARTLAERFQGN
jgi:hypothetical protein